MYKAIKKIRIKKAKRLFMLITAITFAIFWLNMTGLLAGQALGISDPYKEITVKQGDTLWSIAQKYGPVKQDIRKTVYDLKKINKLEREDYIYPGQILLIPDNMEKSVM